MGERAVGLVVEVIRCRKELGSVSRKTATALCQLGVY